jgi:hypothetical protein
MGERGACRLETGHASVGLAEWVDMTGILGRIGLGMLTRLLQSKLRICDPLNKT